VDAVRFNQQNIFAVSKVERCKRDAGDALRYELVLVHDSDALCIENVNLCVGGVAAVKENGLLLGVPSGSQISWIQRNNRVLVLRAAASFSLLTRTADFGLFARTASLVFLAGAAGLSCCARTAFGLLAGAASLSCCARAAFSLLAGAADLSCCTRAAFGLLAGAADLSCYTRAANFTGAANLNHFTRTADFARTTDYTGATNNARAADEAFGVALVCDCRNFFNLLKKKHFLGSVVQGDSDESSFACERGGRAT